MKVGEFKQGKFNGRGSCFDRNGKLVYEGQWVNNVINGKGRFIWEDGKSYEGDFKDGRKHGEGTFYDEDGDILYSGTWENDKPVISKMEENMEKELSMMRMEIYYTVELGKMTSQ